MITEIRNCFCLGFCVLFAFLILATDFESIMDMDPTDLMDRYQQTEVAQKMKYFENKGKYSINYGNFGKF